MASLPERPGEGLAGAMGPRAALLIAAAPVFLGPNGFLEGALTANFYDYQRLLEMGCLGLLAVMGLLVGDLRVAAGNIFAGTNRGAVEGLALFFAFGLISGLLGSFPQASLLEWGTWVLAFGSVLVVAGARWRLGAEGDIWLLAVVVAGVTLYLGNFLAIYLPTLAHPDVTIFWTTPFYHFPNVRFMNQFQTWTLPLLAGAAVLARGYSSLLFGLIAAVGGLWWALLFATGSRGAILAAGLSALVVLLIFKGRAYRWLLTTAALVLLGLLFFWLLYELPGGSPGLERAVEKSASTDHNRLTLWTKALGLAWDHPLLGIGPMLWATEFKVAAHPHNAFFQILAEWGIPAAAGGFGATIIGLLEWSRLWYRNNWGGEASEPALDHWSASFAPALTAGLFAGMIHAMVSGIVVMPLSQMLAIITVGWIWGIYCSHQMKVPATGRTGTARLPRAVVVAALTTGLIAILPGITLTLGGIAEAHRHYQRTEDFRFYPRFWLQGDLGLRPWQQTPATDESLANHSQTR